MTVLEAPALRPYRQRLISSGQSSPLNLSDVPIEILRAYARTPVSLIDVGCGLGDQMRKIRSQLPQSFSRVEGIDWSPATVRHHATTGIYDRVTLADSGSLPFDNGAFDVALSMENLEHLYGQLAVHAIGELARVARLIVITVPTPRLVVNTAWLQQELQEARHDAHPMPAEHYCCLESAVHKSSLDPESMVAAGFQRIAVQPEHGHYYGVSGQIDTTKIKCIGIDEIPATGDDHRARYVGLLQASLGLQASLRANWPHNF